MYYIVKMRERFPAWIQTVAVYGGRRDSSPGAHAQAGYVGTLLSSYPPALS